MHTLHQTVSGGIPLITVLITSEKMHRVECGTGAEQQFK